MTVRPYCRIHSQAELEPSAIPLLGLWRLPQQSGCWMLNEVRASPGDFVVPDARGRWTLSEPGANVTTTGVFDPRLLPDENDNASVQAIGLIIGDVIRCGGLWLEWLNVSPLVPRVSDQVKMQPLDLAIGEHMGYLEEVCRKPRTHLRTEVERENVSRVRRMPAHAPTFLASHTEDWDRPTLRSVRPIRLLSLVRYEQVDIYENRVAARLVDRLVSWLNGRIGTLRRIRSILRRTRQYGISTDTTYRLRDRVCRLWGQEFDTDNTWRMVSSTLRRLEVLKQRVLGLMDSFLYRSVPRGARVSDSLIMTNILADDPTYRHLTVLWHLWSKHGPSRRRSPARVYKEWQDTCLSFDHYCMLLVVRALDQLDFCPSDVEASIGPKRSIVLEWRGLSCSLESRDGIINVGLGGRPVLRFVPVVTPLQSAPQPDLLTAWLVVLRSLSAASADCLTVVLYLSTPEGEGAGRQDLEDGLQHSLETIGNEVPISERIGALPVSPWDINSVERVARAARWALTAPMLLEYPPPVSIPNPSIIDIGETAWLEIGQAGRGHILRIPSDMELQALGVAEKEKSLRQRRDEQTEHRNALEGQTRHRLRIHQEIDEVKSAIAQLTLFLKEVEQATVALRRLAKCPLCPAVDETRFEPRPGLFECICGSCKARWGTRRCTHCRRSYPYLLPALPANTDIDRSAGWIDRVVGSDVLAVPVSLSLHDGFICPHCGARRVEGLSSGRT